MMSGFAEDWAAPLVDPEAFREEQRRLEHAWTFLGFAKDVARDGDWFRATLATRSVFVQRFGEEVRGFENVCPHRFYPLRTADKGNGPVICGFHEWQFNSEGKVAGIPVCKLLYDKKPAEVGAELRRVELATCGQLIFGRFAAPGVTGSLEDFLGDLFPVVEAMTRTIDRPLLVERPMAANWRLYLHISLDDYHAVAVHPSTFGRHGYTKTLERHRYVRVGANSALLNSGDERCFEKLVAGCRAGTYRSEHYFVMQILPNLLLAHVDADRGFWFCTMMHFEPITHDRSRLRGWSFPAQFDSSLGAFGRATRPISDPFRRRIFFHYFKRVFNEDAAVCERIQEVAHQIEGVPILGAMERRIGWYEESLRELGDGAAGSAQG